MSGILRKPFKWYSLSRRFSFKDQTQGSIVQATKQKCYLLVTGAERNIICQDGPFPGDLLSPTPLNVS